MTGGPAVVLDASAVLAMLHEEPGGRDVEDMLEGSVLSAVNLAEVMQRSVARGVSLQGLVSDLRALGITVVPFTAEDAEASAALWPSTHGRGLSLGDRACLALALRLGAPAITADHAWRGISVGVEVRLVR